MASEPMRNPVFIEHKKTGLPLVTIAIVSFGSPAFPYSGNRDFPPLSHPRFGFVGKDWIPYSKIFQLSDSLWNGIKETKRFPTYWGVPRLSWAGRQAPPFQDVGSAVVGCGRGFPQFGPDNYRLKNYRKRSTGGTAVGRASK